MKRIAFAMTAILLMTAACATKPVSAEKEAAPPLQIAQWVKGAPVNLADLKGKKAAVVEFWATWCPPCRVSIPHMTELQKTYRDSVVFVAITDEAPEDVKPFVEKMGSKMDYTVAIDDKVATAKAYMDARGVNTIPYAFVIGKDGAILFHGHPLDEAFDAAVKKAAEK